MFGHKFEESVRGDSLGWWIGSKDFSDMEEDGWIKIKLGWDDTIYFQALSAAPVTKIHSPMQHVEMERLPDGASAYSDLLKKLSDWSKPYVFFSEHSLGKTCD
ncbi:hypothetical protein EYC84_007214 [Monilinia fructicola]|uniref:Uncharacterized protein n=1 Tax=Monilinia fructicola TaxID=38448 RepID=A0A5M9KA29_MONFR|nr:hypothetical protein EYC84_007214 [Monilinia fructicola]